MKAVHEDTLDERPRVDLRAHAEALHALDLLRRDLVDVVFSSGIERVGAVTRLYAGISDAEAQWVEIAYPFDAAQADSSGRLDDISP